MLSEVNSFMFVASLAAIVASCPEMNGMTNFNMSAFLGSWREVLRVPSNFETGYSCMMDHYYTSGDGKTLLYSHAYNASKGAYDTMEGVVETIAPEENGRFVIKTGNESAWDSPYWVLRTDYSNYLVLYGCLREDEATTVPITWVMTRQPPLNSKFLPVIDEILGAYGMNRDQLEEVPQTDCPPLPFNIIVNDNLL